MSTKTANSIRTKMFKDANGENLKVVTVNGINYSWNKVYEVYHSMKDYSHLRKDMVPDDMSYDVYSSNTLNMNKN